MIKAVLVGVEHYPEASASWNLDGPAHDVQRVLTYLRKQGVPKESVRCYISALPGNAGVVNAIRANAAEVGEPTESALNDLIEKALPGESADPLFLYWSGHGFMEKDGERRLFTADAKQEFKRNVNLNNLLAALDSDAFPRIRRVDAIIDTCANYMAATATGISDRSFYVGKRDAGGEQRVLCAASAGQFAINLKSKQMGLFTDELMKLAEATPLAGGILFDFASLIPALRARFETLRTEGVAQHAPTLIWTRANGGEATAPLPPTHEGDLFLTRLGVFNGSFSFLGCTALYYRSGTLEVEAQVSRLRAAGLLVSHETVPRRYRLTPEAHALAQERLAVLGQIDDARAHHAQYYANLARTHEHMLRSPARRGSIDLLEQELENIRKALDWCEAHPELVEQGLQTAAALFWFWNLTGRFELGARRLSALLAAGGAASEATRAQAHYAAGALAFMRGKYPRACDLLGRSKDFWAAQPPGEERNTRLAYTLVVLTRAREDTKLAIKDAKDALKLFKTGGDRWGQALAFNDLGYVLTRAGRWDKARSALIESLSLWRTLGDPWGTPLTLNNVGMVLLRDGEVEAARKVHEEALQFQLEEGDTWGAAESLKYLGEVAMVAERPMEARDCFRSSLDRLSTAPREQLRLDCLLGLARVAAEHKLLDKEQAAPIAAALSAWRCGIIKGRLVLPPHHEELAGQLEKRLSKVLGDLFSDHSERGKDLSVAEALALVGA